MSGIILSKFALILILAAEIANKIVANKQKETTQIRLLKIIRSSQLPELLSKSLISEIIGIPEGFVLTAIVEYLVDAELFKK